MITRPLFKNFSAPTYQHLLLAMVILMFTCVCAETDIYVPAFPQMIDYFGIAESEIQLVLSINSLALGIASMLVGPLSDSFGRRKLILSGLTLFMLSSVALVVTDNFQTLLILRFIQGFAAAVPMVCAGAMVLDTYSGEKASKLIGMINAVITTAIAAAPIIGAYLSEVFGWRANFIAVMILSIVTFLGFLLTIEESLAPSLRQKLNPSQIIKDYIKVLSSLPFICYCLIACFPFITIAVYITNLSVIFINHLGIPLAEYSYYQASTMSVFVVFSLGSIKLIEKKGVDFTKNLGGILALLGAICLLITGVNLPDSLSP